MESTFELPSPERRIFCNRTLNMRSIRAVGCDMDYTLIHYRVEAWEGRAYEYVRGRLEAEGWPVGDLTFDSTLHMRGLVLDQELGNVVKADRFGFVRKASHGTRMLSFEEQRKVYGDVQVDLAEPRWVFLNTFFSLSEACLYGQLVELLDAGKLQGVMGYADVRRKVRKYMDATHMEGELKREIVENPDRFVELDKDLPLALLDLKQAGKLLLLITNSEWAYTKAMMRYAFDGLLPGSMTWRELFDIVIVSSRKPDFFTTRAPAFEVVDEEGLLRPLTEPIRPGGTYLGGNADRIEQDLGLSGEEFLYIGDHIFADVHASKSLLRWRTALVIRELEKEMRALEDFKPKQREIARMMADKEVCEQEHAWLRLELQRIEGGYGPKPGQSVRKIKLRLQTLRKEMLALDEQIGPLVKEAVELVNTRWGLLMRAGNDKSHLARQVERYADVYTSRVSNLLSLTPFFYLRAPRGSLPHDSGPAGGV
jgi:HAD superfamily 5'-nucleotidase-like hydrolase